MTLPTEFLIHVASLLARLEIPFQVGGSLASSAHGLYRASADVDLVIDPTPGQLERLAATLEPEFYVSRAAMAEALAGRSTFNAIHVETSFKIDFFIKGVGPFDAEEMRRSLPLAVPGAAGGVIPFKSPEDTVLRKLEWFRRGGESSDRQWQDVVSVLASNVGKMDEAYLDHWAHALGVSDLLARARRVASVL